MDMISVRTANNSIRASNLYFKPILFCAKTLIFLQRLMLFLQIFDETQSRDCDDRIKKWHSSHRHNYRYVKVTFCCVIWRQIALG